MSVELRADLAPAPPDEQPELELARRLGEAEVLVLGDEAEVDLEALLPQEADTHAHRRVDAVDAVLVVDADAQGDAVEQLSLDERAELRPLIGRRVVAAEEHAEHLLVPDGGAERLRQELAVARDGGRVRRLLAHAELLIGALRFFCAGARRRPAARRR